MAKVRYKNWLSKHGEFVASTGGQWNGSGIPIEFTMWETEEGAYVLTVDLQDEMETRQFCKDNGYDEIYVDETVNWCERFDVAFLGKDDVEATKLATDIISKELNDGQGFEVDEVFGWIVGY